MRANVTFRARGRVVTTNQRVPKGRCAEDVARSLVTEAQMGFLRLHEIYPAEAELGVVGALWSE